MTMFTIITKICLITSAVIICGVQSAHEPKLPKISLSISAKHRHIEISWNNIDPTLNGVILITEEEPQSNIEFKQEITSPNISPSRLPPAKTNDDLILCPNSPTTESPFSLFESLSSSPSPPLSPPSPSPSPTQNTELNSTICPENNNNSSDEKSEEFIEIFGLEPSSMEKKSAALVTNVKWTYNDKPIRYWIQPEESTGWHITTIPFSYELSKRVLITTKCYGFWATYYTLDGQRNSTTCIRAYPTWMNDMRDHIGKFMFNELFLVGTHDSGSYQERFDPKRNETRVSKYSITQDDNIFSQLMHGVRYLDIRVGYYRSSTPQFWVNHAIARQQPLNEVMRQVREFVLLTNEIVIFDVQEFPVGFGKKKNVHRQLVQYVREEFGDLLVDPELTWDTTLDKIWQRKQNIIFSYDLQPIVHEFPQYVWSSVMQRWGNVQSSSDLKRYLAPNGRNFFINSRPIADMAELTPTAWDVITDRFGGLRRMADFTNRQICQWYENEWGSQANIVAVDFYRGTNLMETAMHWNQKKTPIQSIDEKN